MLNFEMICEEYKKIRAQVNLNEMDTEAAFLDGFMKGVEKGMALGVKEAMEILAKLREPK